MSGFMLGAALLLLLAVAFAVSALWNSSRRLAIALAVALPVAAISLYMWRGTPQAIDAPAVAQAPVAADAATPAGAAPPAPDIDQLVAELEAGLARDPSRWDGWQLLGNIRLEQGDYPAARAAFAKAYELNPDDDGVAVGYAESMMRTSADRRFPPEAVSLLERAAKAKPPLPKGVFLLGMHRLVSGQPREAAEMWESLLPGMEPAAAAALSKQIAIARGAAGQPALPATGAIKITVTPGKHLADEAAAGGILFVFARPKGGGPPVAARRLVVERWPVEVTLSDADQPMPTAKLSAQDDVLLVARLSRTGNAIAASGDLESHPIEVRVADGAAAILLLEIVRP